MSNVALELIWFLTSNVYTVHTYKNVEQKKQQSAGTWFTQQPLFSCSLKFFVFHLLVSDKPSQNTASYTVISKKIIFLSSVCCNH